MSRRKIYRLDESGAEDCCLKTPAGEIPYRLFKSSRRTTMQISVTRSEQVRVTVPMFVTRTIIESFIRERTRWIQDKISEVQRANQFTGSRNYDTGHEFLFLGKNYPLYVEETDGKQARVAFDDNGWIIRVPSGLDDDQRRGKVKEKLVQWYRDQAQEVLGARLFHYVRVMKLEPMRIAVRTQKRIWGSCRYHDKVVSLNWLLVLAPMHVIDYVIVHELAHLKHPNHSKHFWAKVETFLPDYRERQEWLKAHHLEMTLP